MLCDELKKRHYSEMDADNTDDEMYYPANKVDAAIEEFKAENERLKRQNEAMRDHYLGGLQK